MNVKPVSTAYSVSAVLCLQCVAGAMPLHMIKVLCFYINTFRNMCAVYGIAVLCSSLMSCFSGMLIRYFMHFLNVFTVTPITGVLISP